MAEGSSVPGKLDASPDAAAVRIGARLRALLDAEWRRVERHRKALECVCDAALEREWRATLEHGTERVADLVHRLAALDPAQCADATPRDLADDPLIGAMALAIGIGDQVAAQAVARECVALAEVHYARELDAPQQAGRAARTPPARAADLRLRA
ncbi:MAG TPA: hypothetical protein VGC30_10625 [Dokdonella sp.]